MSMPRAVRHINEIRVLEALFRQGRMSRADIARDLGLTRSTASSIVASLIDEGFIIDDDGEEDRGAKTGRPGTPVRLRPQHALFIGGDIGIGRVTVVAIDLQASIVAEHHAAFDADDAQPEAIATQLARLITTTIADLAGYRVRGVCVAVAGIVDHVGNILRVPILGWSGVPILDLIGKSIPPVPVLIGENDANAFAMAEMYRTGRHAPQAALYLFLDAGVGGAIVSSGEILRGKDGYAGELGHMIIGEQGFVELLSLPGSLESYVGRDAVLARYRFHGGDAASLDAFLAAARAAEPAAAATLIDWSFYLGRGLATLTSIFNPEKIVLGGPVSVLFGLAQAPVMAALRKNLLPGHPVPAIEASALGLEGPAIGGASILHKRLLSVDQALVFGNPS